MKIPSELIIGDSLWSVKYKRCIEPGTHYGKEIAGLCDPSTYEISIKRNLAPEEKLETFIHEVLHACEHEWEKDIPHELIYFIGEKLARIIFENFLG